MLEKYSVMLWTLKVREMKEYLEYQDEKSQKFWEVSVRGKAVTVRFGKVGAGGQTKTKEFDSNVRAKADAEKQAAAKKKKGYQQASANQSTPSLKAPSKSKKKSPVKKAPAAKKKVEPEVLDPTTATKIKLVAWCKAEARSAEELARALGRFPESDRVIAGRDDCPPELLSQLSHSSDKSTRGKVTANLNVPKADFIRLGQLFTKEFLANPLLDVLLLEEPGLLEDLPTTLLVRIAKNETCPSPYLKWAAGYDEEKVQLAVAMNPSAPDEAIAKLRIE